MKPFPLWTRHHVLSSCPCADCKAERGLQKALSNGGNRIVTVPVLTARVLGLLKNPNPHGSLGRELRLRAEKAIL